MREKLAKFLILVKSIIPKIARVLWEVVCWLIVPVVFGYLCYASLTKKLDITILQICLAVIALSPWMLRLVTRYLSEFDIGPKGVSGKTRETARNKGEIESKEPENRFSAFLPQTKKVLRTLWKHQVEHFGPDDIRRWGFTVGVGTPDYNDFSLGVLELARLRLVVVDLKAFVFLTDSGVQYCKEHNEEIAKYPYYYSHFSN